MSYPNRSNAWADAALAGNERTSRRNKLPRGHVVFWLLWLYVGMSPLIKVPFQGDYLTGVELLFPVAASLLPLVLQRASLRPATGFLIAYLLVVVFSQSYVPTSALVDTVPRSFRLVAIALPFLLSATLLSENQLERLFRVAFWALALSILLGALGFYMGWEMFRAGQTYDYSGGLAARAGGIFRDSGPYGFAVGLWFSLGWMYYLTGYWPRARGILLLGFLVMLTALALYASLSRVAAALIVFALFGSPLLLHRWTLFVRVLTLLLIGVAGIWILSMLGAIDLRVLYQRFYENTVYAAGDSLNDALSGRISIWLSYLPMLLDSLFFGVGYKALITVYHVPPDNAYLGALVETGIIGAFFYVGFHLAVLLRLRKLMWTCRRPIYFISFLLWVEVMVAALSADVMTYWGIAPVYLALIGAVYHRGGCSNA